MHPASLAFPLVNRKCGRKLADPDRLVQTTMISQKEIKHGTGLKINVQSFI